MAIQGLRDTSNFVADQRPQNWRQGILTLYPNGKAPLTALTNLMKSKSTDDPQFNWWEKALPAQRLQLNVNLTVGANTLGVNPTVTDGGGLENTALQLRKGHVLRIEQTGELVLVIADPTSANTIPVLRAFGETVATAIADVAGAGVNPNVHVIGTANEEGSLAPTGINYNPVKQYNLTQIFRDTLEMTRTASKTNLRTGDQVKEAKRECLELHSIEMEKAFIFGDRYESVMNGKPIRTTRGVVRWLRALAAATNVVDNAGAAINMLILEAWLERIFRFGSSEKMAFVGNGALLTIQQVIRRNSQMQITPIVKEYGMDVTRLVCPFGTLVLKTHPLFNQLSNGVNGASPYYGYNSAMLVLDMENITYRHFTGDDTRYEKDLTPKGMDGMKSGYLTEAGLEVDLIQTHFLITGFGAAAVDS